MKLYEANHKFSHYAVHGLILHLYSFSRWDNHMRELTWGHYGRYTHHIKKKKKRVKNKDVYQSVTGSFTFRPLSDFLSIEELDRFNDLLKSDINLAVTMIRELYKQRK